MLAEKQVCSICCTWSNDFYWMTSTPEMLTASFHPVDGAARLCGDMTFGDDVTLMTLMSKVSGVPGTFTSPGRRLIAPQNDKCIAGDYFPEMQRELK